VFSAWAEVVQREPHLYEQLLKSPFPAKFAYETVKRRQSLRVIGDDPEAWIAKTREEIKAALKAEIEAEYTKAQPEGPVRDSQGRFVPVSIATQRSVAPRAPVDPGPRPLTEIFKR
jgi:hypothetical protein